MTTNSTLLQGHLRAIAKPRDPFENYESLLEVEAYVTGQLRSFGYTVRKFPFDLEKRILNNIIASKAPSSPKPRLIIGAHIDAVPGTEGADDNASGIAVLLETARLLANDPDADKVDFIAFNAEEYGMVGSTRYAEHLKKISAQIEGMISLEMVGFTSQAKGSQKTPFFLKPFYPDVGNFLALVGDQRSKQFLEKAKEAFQKIRSLPVESLCLPAKGWVFPETRLSDHSPFWDAGYPALLVTDTSFFRNPHYHTPQDKIETLNFDFMGKVTEGVISLIKN